MRNEKAIEKARKIVQDYVMLLHTRRRLGLREHDVWTYEILLMMPNEWKEEIIKRYRQNIVYNDNKRLKKLWDSKCKRDYKKHHCFERIGLMTHRDGSASEVFRCMQCGKSVSREVEWLR